MAHQIGELRFVLSDDREIVYNESVDLTYLIYSEDEDDEFIEIDDLVDRCMAFAQAIGFTKETVERAFGRK